MIGVCIKYFHENYGGMLQAFATVKMLESRGIDYELIRYKKKLTIRVKEICGINEVHTIARNQLKTAKKPIKILYLLAFVFKQEWIFFWIFVGKKKNS